MRELAELPEEAREQAMSRYRLLEPHLAHGQDLPLIMFKHRPIVPVVARRKDNEGEVRCVHVRELRMRMMV